MKSQLYIAFCGRFPSEKAAALFVAENARSLSAYAPVTILVPRIAGTLPEDTYVLPPEVQVIRLHTLELFGWLPSRLAFYVRQISFANSIFWHLRKRSRESWVIADDVFPAFAATWAGHRVLFEVHDFPQRGRWVYRLLFARVALIMATNIWKQQELKRLFPASAGKVIMERNGVDLKAFGNTLTLSDTRRVLGLPQDRPIVMYTGHLYSWKGVDTFLGAAALIPEALFVCVGGTFSDVATYTKRHKNQENVRFVGHVAHAEIPIWQSAADALCLPNTAHEEISVRYTSPMKLFEYMASGRPIIASNLPSIAEVLPENAAWFVTPDEPLEIERAFKALKADPEEAVVRAKRARKVVEEYSWQVRAGRLARHLHIV